MRHGKKNCCTRNNEKNIECLCTSFYSFILYYSGLKACITFFYFIVTTLHALNPISTSRYVSLQCFFLLMRPEKNVNIPLSLYLTKPFGSEFISATNPIYTSRYVSLQCFFPLMSAGKNVDIPLSLYLIKPPGSEFVSTAHYFSIFFHLISRQLKSAKYRYLDIPPAKSHLRLIKS